MGAGGLLHQQWLQRGQRVGDRSTQAEVDRGAPAEVAASHVDLDHARVLGIELLVGEVGAEHQEDVGLLDGLVAGRESEQSRHADVERIVVLDELLAAQRVHDRRVERAGQPDQRVMGACHSGAAEDGDVLGAR